MIKLFVTDIDGCLATPYEPYDLNGLARLRNQADGTADMAPSLSICSGRSYPYVEAMAQALDLKTPVLFEAGGGQFDPVSAQTTWNPALTDEIEAEIREVQRWFVTECVPGTKLSLDHAKRTQAGVVSPDADDIAEVRPRTKDFVAEHAPDLRVFATEISLDVVPKGITKRHGLEWLADTLGLDMSEIAYIGDTEGDLAALRAVGTSFAPANAQEAVREQVDHVTEGSVIEGTIEAYRHCRTQAAAQ